MTWVLEISGPFQRRPSRYHSRVVTRWVWLWFAIERIHVPWREFCETSYRWEWK